MQSEYSPYLPSKEGKHREEEKKTFNTVVLLDIFSLIFLVLNLSHFATMCAYMLSTTQFRLNKLSKFPYIYRYRCLHIALAKTQTSKWSNIKTSSKQLCNKFPKQTPAKLKKKMYTTTSATNKIYYKYQKYASFTRRHAWSRFVFLFHLNDKQKREKKLSSPTASSGNICKYYPKK